MTTQTADQSIQDPDYPVARVFLASDTQAQADALVFVREQLWHALLTVSDAGVLQTKWHWWLEEWERWAQGNQRHPQLAGVKAPEQMGGAAEVYVDGLTRLLIEQHGLPATFDEVLDWSAEQGSKCAGLWCAQNDALDLPALELSSLLSYQCALVERNRFLWPSSWLAQHQLTQNQAASDAQKMAMLREGLAQDGLTRWQERKVSATDGALDKLSLIMDRIAAAKLRLFARGQQPMQRPRRYAVARLIAAWRGARLAKC